MSDTGSPEPLVFLFCRIGRKLLFFFLFLQIIIQCFTGLILTCYGVVQVSGNFKEIRANADLDNK